MHKIDVTSGWVGSVKMRISEAEKSLTLLLAGAELVTT